MSVMTEVQKLELDVENRGVLKFNIYTYLIQQNLHVHYFTYAHMHYFQLLDIVFTTQLSALTVLRKLARLQHAYIHIYKHKGP